MALKLTFRKKGDKPSTLTCERPDGTSCWTHLHSGIEDHDLAHYAVESILKFRNAFFGLVADGIDIGDFEKPQDQKAHRLSREQLPLEATQAEYIVNLLQAEYWNYGENTDFLSTLSQTLNSREIPFPRMLTEEKLEIIRKEYHELIFKWKSLPVNEPMVLIFDIE